MPRSAPATIALLIAVAACSGSSPSPSNPQSSSSVGEPSTQPSPSAGATEAPFPFSSEPLAIEPGTYRIAESAWSVADFTVTFPEGWTVQAGHVFAKNPDETDEFGFYSVVVDEIYADACKGDSGEIMELGSNVDDLATALLDQPALLATGPTPTTLGRYPASRVDVTIPPAFDLQACSFGDIGLQVWHSRPADKYFVLLADAVARVYIVDVEGQRQVFLVQHGLATSDEDLAELQGVLDSIHIEP